MSKVTFNGNPIDGVGVVNKYTGYEMQSFIDLFNGKLRAKGNQLPNGGYINFSSVGVDEDAVIYACNRYADKAGVSLSKEVVEYAYENNFFDGVGWELHEIKLALYGKYSMTPASPMTYGQKLTGE